MTMIAAPMTPARSPRRLGTVEQLLRGERQRALEGHLAHAGEQLLVGLAEVAADDDHVGVEEVHARGQHLAERAAGLADHPHGAGVARAHEAHDVARAGGLEPDLGQPPGQRAAAGDRLEAADVAAAADDVVVARRR